MERINREALFCDETEDYRHPCEADAGQRVIFYFRTERDGADSVYFIEFDRQGRMKERDMVTACLIIIVVIIYSTRRFCDTVSEWTVRMISVFTDAWERWHSRTGRHLFA